MHLVQYAADIMPRETRRPGEHREIVVDQAVKRALQYTSYGEKANTERKHVQEFSKQVHESFELFAETKRPIPLAVSRML